MIRVAAVGDVHFDKNSAGRIRDHLEEIRRQADILLIAGDLTQVGHVEEAKVLADDLEGAGIPVVVVLGNHDYHLGQQNEISEVLANSGVIVLEGNTTIIQVGEEQVGIAGIKGFGGGFSGACASEFGEEEMKHFIQHTKSQALKLKDALLSLHTPYRIALMHYSPIPETLAGEKLEIYPFLGSYLLSEAVDQGEVDVVFHGHAHRGMEKGMTFGGVPVRNVAQPVIRHVCNIYSLNKEGLGHSHRVAGMSQFSPHHT